MNELDALIVIVVVGERNYGVTDELNLISLYVVQQTQIRPYYDMHYYIPFHIFFKDFSLDEICKYFINTSLGICTYTVY